MYYILFAPYECFRLFISNKKLNAFFSFKSKWRINAFFFDNKRKIPAQNVLNDCNIQNSL